MIKDYLKITDDPTEIRRIAERLVKDITINIKGNIKAFYTPLMLKKMDEEIQHYSPETTLEEREELRYKFIYDYWVYGCTVDEEFYLHLKNKTDAEKREYIVRQLRNIYVQHLNWNAGPDRVEKLEDKYRLYQILKPYYKRDVIEIRTLEDLELFTAFAKKHKVFVVKPADFSFGIGVHKFSMDSFGEDYKAAMESILSEGEAIHEKHPSKVSRMVLEELIQQDETMASLHRDSVNAIRATAVKGKDEQIHIYHPWIKVGIRGSFVATAAQDGFVSEIDPTTGCLMTDGFQETGEVYTHHPDTGIKIKGFQIPRWNELKEFVNHIMAELPEYGYIGWDLVLTPDGWCVMEGNYSGEFMFQLINGCGYKKDFEELIGWKYDKDFWWEDAERFAHN